MSKREPRSWIVPVEARYEGTVFVKAENADEARVFVEEGVFDEFIPENLYQFEVTGNPKENV